MKHKRESEAEEHKRLVRCEGAALWPALLVMDWFYGDGVHGGVWCQAQGQTLMRVEMN